MEGHLHLSWPPPPSKLGRCDRGLWKAVDEVAKICEEANVTSDKILSVSLGLNLGPETGYINSFHGFPQSSG
jgi:hypothetical protein